jgi:Flp pilus assembly secretin CpaC
MRRQLALAIVALVACPSLAQSGEEGATIAPAPHELRGPQLPAAAEESREVVRLASAVEPAATNRDQRTLLKAKLAELDRLQGEIQQLREATQTAHSIYVSVEVLEVSLTKMRELGTDISAKQGGVSPMTRRESDEFIMSLKANNVCRTLASPSVLMMSGNPASIFTGSRIAIPLPAGSDKPIDYVESGIGLDVTADAVGANRVRVSVQPRISSASEPMPTGEGQPALPRLKVWQCTTSCEMEFGETFILSGQVEERVEAVRRFYGKTEEKVIEIARWVVVRVDDAAQATGSQRAVGAVPSTTVAAPYTPPAVR